MQIGDENVHLVRSVLDEVFGSENFVSMITFLKTSGAGSPAIGTKVLASVADTILWYGKNKDELKYRQLFQQKTLGEEGATQYTWIQSPDGKHVRPMTEFERQSPTNVEKGWRILAHDNLTSQSGAETTRMEVEIDGRRFRPTKGGWKTNAAGMANLKASDRLMVVGDTPRYRRLFDDFPYSPINNVWRSVTTSGFADAKIYVVQTNPAVIERCLLMTTDPGDLVLDPTTGSGTTAYVAEQWGRRWITVDTSRVALALARTRLVTARFPYYLLADSPEGIRKEAELTGVMPPATKTTGDIKRGFVYRRVPHVTLKSIANNPDIREGMTREEIDAAIARHAESETLFDQPYEDKRRVRVTGPFTVESLSPHRQISVERKRAHAEQGIEGVSVRVLGPNQFAHTIIDYLKKAGVQNTVKEERLVFDRLEPFAGEYIHAEGEYTENGESKRVAVCIGPEYGTVSPELVKEAAKESVRGLGFDLLVVCGFAFDPHVSQETRHYGKLTVLPAKMNPDLSMGDELLKKTGAGNLFMVFGEPDIEVRRDAGQVTVAIHGLDVYDPTTGQIRSSSTDDIACWFIDTAYNGESFFVRHAYFTGATEPYDKLKRALRAEIDEAAWSALYSTTSRPFDPPATGKIAVKVINHYGDEVLKVYDVKA